MTTPTDERLIVADTTMGSVSLRVGDLEKMSTYYSQAFAMEPLEEISRGAEIHRVLGRGTDPLVKLIHTPDLPAVDPREAGLFHTAFLFDSAESLVATVCRLAQKSDGRFVGSSDHLVSEAFAHGRSVTVADTWGTRISVVLPDVTTEELLAR